MTYHNNPRPAFPPPAEYSAIRQAYEVLKNSSFSDEGGPLRNRHEFLQIGELLDALDEDLRDEIGVGDVRKITDRYF